MVRIETGTGRAGSGGDVTLPSHLPPDLYILCGLKLISQCCQIPKIHWSEGSVTYVVRPNRTLGAGPHSVHDVPPAGFVLCFLSHNHCFLFWFPSFSPRGSGRQRHAHRGNMQILFCHKCKCSWTQSNPRTCWLFKNVLLLFFTAQLPEVFIWCLYTWIHPIVRWQWQNVLKRVYAVCGKQVRWRIKKNAKMLHG